MPAAFGTSTSAAASLVINGATLQYSGPGDSTDRQFTVGVNGATLDASGTGPINFSSGAAVAMGGTVGATHSLNLGGINAGDNTLAALIADSGTGATSLNKLDVGKWMISAANTYTGPTNVAAGTLSVSGSINASTQINVNAGGNLALTGAGTDRIADSAPLTLGNSGGSVRAFLTASNSGGAWSETLGTLTLAGNAVIDLGGNVSTQLTFADSRSVTWGSPATLSIYNWTGNASSPGAGDADQIFVLGGLNALSATQLGQISFFSDAGASFIGGATLLASGQLVPVAVPEPASWMLALSSLGLLGMRRGRRASRTMSGH